MWIFFNGDEEGTDGEDGSTCANVRFGIGKCVLKGIRVSLRIALVGQRDTRDDALIQRGHVYRVPDVNVGPKQSPRFCPDAWSSSSYRVQEPRPSSSSLSCPAHVFSRSNMNHRALRLVFLFWSSPPVPMLQTWLPISAETFLRVSVGNVA